MRDLVHIVFSPDKNYAVHAGVAMYSILHHAVQPSRFAFYLLEGDECLTEATKEKFRIIAQRFGATLYFTPVRSALVDAYGQFGPDYISGAAYYRLLVPDALPQLDRCLYLDCDLVALTSIEPLWDMKIPDTAIAAISDCYVERENLKKYDEIRRYFNSGVLLMNLQLWRERQYVKKCLSLAADPEVHRRFADQDLLNIVFSKDVHFLHPQWNIQTGQEPSCKGLSFADDWRQWEEIRQSPKIAHFTSDRKPWSMEMKHPWALEYWWILAKTPWGAEMPELQRSIFAAKIYRLKARISKLLRWVLTVKSNKENGILIISFCGRLLVARKRESSRHASPLHCCDGA